MLYIVLAYLMLFAALTNSICLNNASFFFLFKYFLCQGYELSGEIARKNNHYLSNPGSTIGGISIFTVGSSHPLVEYPSSLWDPHTHWWNIHLHCWILTPNAYLRQVNLFENGRHVLLVWIIIVNPDYIWQTCLDFILPSLTDIFSSSLASGIFPQCFKSALVIHIIKKRCLNHYDLNNHWAISNLCFIVEILVASGMSHHE